tara:strand:+ start:129 stop:443 length:315 start_codon:yes stop_codon:yes gene_type:complete
MKKFVYVRAADDNANAWPIESFVEARYNDADEIDLHFKGAIGTDSVDVVKLKYGAGDNGKKAMLAIGEVFANYNGGAFLKLADKVDNKYATSEITDVTSITLAS